MSEEFIGRGWAFPLRTDATGGIALVSREREIEEAIRLILGTAPGERPMRPEFGCRIHDYVFASADGADRRRRSPSRSRDALRRWEPRIDVDDVDVTLRRRRPDACCTSTSATRSGATNDRRNLVFPFYVIPEEARSSTDGRCRAARTSTTAASRTSSTTPSASSSSAARSGPTTTSPTRA